MSILQGYCIASNKFKAQDGVASAVGYVVAATSASPWSVVTSALHPGVQASEGAVTGTDRKGDAVEAAEDCGEEGPEVDGVDDGASIGYWKGQYTPSAVRSSN